MNSEKVIFAFFIVLALTLNFGFFIGDIDNPVHHDGMELAAALVGGLKQDLAQAEQQDRDDGVEDGLDVAQVEEEDLAIGTPADADREEDDEPDKEDPGPGATDGQHQAPASLQPRIGRRGWGLGFTQGRGPLMDA